MDIRNYVKFTFVSLFFFNPKSPREDMKWPNRYYASSGSESLLRNYKGPQVNLSFALKRDTIFTILDS